MESRNLFSSQSRLLFSWFRIRVSLVSLILNKKFIINALDANEAHRRAEYESLKDNLPEFPKELYFMRQYADNCSATVAVIHIIFNILNVSSCKKWELILTCFLIQVGLARRKHHEQELLRKDSIFDARRARKEVGRRQTFYCTSQWLGSSRSIGTKQWWRQSSLHRSHQLRRKVVWNGWTQELSDLSRCNIRCDFLDGCRESQPRIHRSWSKQS